MAIKGKIEAVSENKAGYWAIKVNGDWYGTGAKDEPGFGKGDLVSFDYYKKDGRWLQVKGEIEAAKGGSKSGGTSGARSSGGDKDGYWNAKAAADAAREPRIAFQGAFERAIEVFKIADAKGAYPSLEKVKPAERLGAIRALVEAEALHIMQLSWNAVIPGATEKVADDEEDGDESSDEDGDDKWNED